MAYLTPAELAQLGGVSADFLTRFSIPDQQEAINQAGSIADGYARTHYSPPFTSGVGTDWKLRVAQIAVYLLVSRLGVPPEGLDTWVMQNYQDAMRWLELVSRGTVVPISTVDQTPGTFEGAPAVVNTGGVRGW